MIENVERNSKTMRHLTPALSSRIFTPSLIPLYTFLSSSPTSCILHVASHVALNPILERPCILCRHYRTIFPKTKKAPLKIRNVDLNNTNVASHVALNLSLERPCILCRHYRTIFPKTKKASLKIRNVDLANAHVASYVALNLSLERACILLQEKMKNFQKREICFRNIASFKIRAERAVDPTPCSY
jgi:hypothetical protein